MTGDLTLNAAEQMPLPRTVFSTLKGLVMSQQAILHINEKTLRGRESYPDFARLANTLLKTGTAENTLGHPV